ncbi:MAG: divalent-cation tolerance protein CutA [Patescibacteria group bacterium]|nr:divalent-cation tolerance protein CutA [Patescibacteria group bacterium]
MLFEKIEKENKDIVFVYTTCPNKDEAKSIGQAAIDKQLAVCADLWPINSIYLWQKVIQDVNQYMLMMTTQKSLGKRLIKFVSGIHSYKVPFVVECSTQVSNSLYHLWVDKTLKGKSGYVTEYQDKILKKNKKQRKQGYNPGKLK